MKLNTKLFFALAITLLSTTQLAIAGPASDALSTCLSDNTTGKDRKNMAIWVYTGLSTHPEISSLSNVTDKKRDELDKIIAAMFTRLITEACPAQAKMAVEQEGDRGFQSAFGVIGMLAMQELMSNQKVNAAFTNFVKYADQPKIDAVLKNRSTINK